MVVISGWQRPTATGCVTREVVFTPPGTLEVRRKPSRVGDTSSDRLRPAPGSPWVGRTGIPGSPKAVEPSYNRHFFALPLRFKEDLMANCSAKKNVRRQAQNRRAPRQVSAQHCVRHASTEEGGRGAGQGTRKPPCAVQQDRARMRCDRRPKRNRAPEPGFASRRAGLPRHQARADPQRTQKTIARKARRRGFLLRELRLPENA